jgi:hypothetical protein
MNETENLKKEIEELRKQLSSYQEIAYATINDRGDLFDLRFHNNPYIDQKTVVKLYVKHE